MEDRCYVLLQIVVEENSRLRATIEARDAQQQRLFEELSLKLESTHSGQTKQSRKRTRPINVPQQCRQDFRKIYKALTNSDNESFQGFVMGESFSTEANQSATKTVIEAVVADHGGTNKCPWSTAELRGRFFQNS
ncbi:hypothetical protein P5673_030108 [Acropora cervicornis]|uniref:Uncharacterized protein n=1 Tax=Acropora cervicornis TaxID=6130 RepID=A0AAD9PV31_ACRCE|nr:hypothetical protein P5673_030108 [Acropora cervicornis]